MAGWDDDDENTIPIKVRDADAPTVSDSETLVFPVDPNSSGEGDANFDYDAFEAALDDISREEEQQAQAAAEPPPTNGPVDRATHPRRAITDDATYAVRPVGRFSYVTIQGRVNESFDGESLGTQLRGASTIFELSEVDRITSFGVRGWLRMMQTAALSEAYFVNCSESVVNQITMIHNFCGPARVHSIMAPYLCGSCGAEFGVSFHAVTDVALLKGRRPPEVKCPECEVAAEMDEDPWAFFDLDQQLLEAVPDDLQQVLDLLSVEPRHAPIEKTVTGLTTRVTFNGDLTEKTRFHRALGGIEGKVVLDLGHLDSATDGGLQKLLFSCKQVADEVDLFRLEGVGPALARMLLEQRVPKLWVATLKLPATNANGIRRQALIDVLSNRDALIAGRNPRVEAAWAQAGITLDDAPLAAEIVEQMGVHDAVAPTPAPAPRMGVSTPGPASYPPGAMPGGEATYILPHGTATPAPVAYVQGPPAPNNSRYLLGAAALLMVLAVLVVILAVGLIVSARLVPPQPVAVQAPAPAPTQQLPAPAEAVDGAWSTGGLAPPAWAASPVMQTDTQLFVVGSASGASAEAAAAGARRAALQQLGAYMRAQVLASPAAAGLDVFPMPTDPVALEKALEGATTPLPLMSEAQAATRTLRGSHESVSQFVLDRGGVDSYVDGYTQVADYRGLKLAPTPPWVAPGIRLVATPSWWPVPIGATVETVAGSASTSVEGFVSQASQAYEAMPEGTDFEIVFTTAAGPESISVSKRAAGPSPKPTLLKMDGR